MPDTPVPASTTPTPATTTAASPATASPSASAAAKPRPKRKTARRKTRRRDGDDSDASDDQETDSARPSTAPSTAAASSASAPAPLFPDVHSTTPAAWADSDPKSVEVVSFEEFNRGGAESTRGRRGGFAARGRGRGGKAPATTQHEVANDDAKDAEERAQLKRERQKAKRKEAKERRKAATTNDSDAARAPEDAAEATPNDESLVASTSALTLDSPAANGPPIRNSRGPFPQRVADDPKFTPRVGNFWMHDQRHYESGAADGAFSAPHWRGRGGHRGMPRGAFRGGPRGRGRGFGFVGAPPAPPSVASSSTTGGHRMTEMDKLELEMANKERQKKAQSAADSSGKWGHEGFEEQASTQDAFRAGRALRGRGRGRGLPRGNAPRAFVPAHLPTPDASPDRGAFKATIKPTEGTTTQSAADTLLEDSGSVTIRLPGDSTAVKVSADVVDANVEEATAAAEPAAVSDAVVRTPASDSPFPPPFTPSNASPGPQVASDSGSISSGYLPPAVLSAVPMGGEFYPMQPNFRPPTGPAFYPRNFPPQSFTPEPGMPPMHPHSHPHPHHQQRGSFSGPGFFPGGAGARSNSPLNPYAAQMGYFVPPRPLQKVQIRSADGDSMTKSPTSDAADSTHSGTVEGYLPGYYYNPYNGMGMPEQGVFYPPQGYWPQAYEGDYHGY